MKLLDRVLCIAAALWGILAFLFALRGVGDPRNSYPGWVLLFGIACLIAGLTAASLATWRAARHEATTAHAAPLRRSQPPGAS
jgi:hypothetical protein